MLHSIKHLPSEFRDEIEEKVFEIITAPGFPAQPELVMWNVRLGKESEDKVKALLVPELRKIIKRHLNKGEAQQECVASILKNLGLGLY